MSTNQYFLAVANDLVHLQKETFEILEVLSFILMMCLSFLLGCMANAGTLSILYLHLLILKTIILLRVCCQVFTQLVVRPVLLVLILHILTSSAKVRVQRQSYIQPLIPILSEIIMRIAKVHNHVLKIIYHQREREENFISTKGQKNTYYIYTNLKHVK